MYQCSELFTINTYICVSKKHIEREREREMTCDMYHSSNVSLIRIYNLLHLLNLILVYTDVHTHCKYMNKYVQKRIQFVVSFLNVFCRFHSLYY